MALRNEYLSKSKPALLPDAEGIISLCCQKGRGCNGFAYPSDDRPIAYIKYGYTVTVGEMQTQRYVCSALSQMADASGSGAKVPEIYHAFGCEEQTYIVMEYVRGKTVGAWLRDSSSAETRDWVYDQVAEAIEQLLRVPVPSGSSRPWPSQRWLHSAPLLPRQSRTQGIPLR